MEQWDRNDKLKPNKSLQRLKMKIAYGTMGQKWQTKTQQEFTEAEDENSLWNNGTEMTN